MQPPVCSSSLPNSPHGLVPCPQLGFSALLGTAEAHKAAENVHFVKEFIKCRVDRQIYAQFVATWNGCESLCFFKIRCPRETCFAEEFCPFRRCDRSWVAAAR